MISYPSLVLEMANPPSTGKDSVWTTGWRCKKITGKPVVELPGWETHMPTGPGRQGQWAEWQVSDHRKHRRPKVNWRGYTSPDVGIPGSSPLLSYHLIFPEARFLCQTPTFLVRIKQMFAGQILLDQTNVCRLNTCEM